MVTRAKTFYFRPSFFHFLPVSLNIIAPRYYQNWSLFKNIYPCILPSYLFPLLLIYFPTTILMSLVLSEFYLPRKFKCERRSCMDQTMAHECRANLLMAVVTFAGDIKITSTPTGDLCGTWGIKGEWPFVENVSEERYILRAARIVEILSCIHICIGTDTAHSASRFHDF